MKSEMVWSCSATLLRSFSSLECLIRLSGTLVMKFWSNWTSIVLSLTPSLIFGNGVSLTNELLEEKDLSPLAKALVKLKSRAVYHTPS